LGDSVGDNGICDIKDICHDQQQLTKKYDKINMFPSKGVKQRWIG